MGRTNLTKYAYLTRRRRRVRAKVFGTAERPRLVVFRSNIHMYAQLIDDVSRRTLGSASDFEVAGRSLDRMARAEGVGELVARRARALGIVSAVFDRGGRRYLGRVKALAEAARKAGLKF